MNATHLRSLDSYCTTRYIPSSPNKTGRNHLKLHGIPSALRDGILSFVCLTLNVARYINYSVQLLFCVVLNYSLTNCDWLPCFPGLLCFILFFLSLNLFSVGLFLAIISRFFVSQRDRQSNARTSSRYTRKKV